MTAKRCLVDKTSTPVRLREQRGEYPTQSRPPADCPLQINGRTWDRDAVSILLSTASDHPLLRCLCGGYCLCSGLCPQRPTSSSSTAFLMYPLTILITFIATYGRGTVSRTRTMLHSKVMRLSRVKWDFWMILCRRTKLYNRYICHNFCVCRLFHCSVCLWQFLPGTCGKVFLRTTSACCISGTVVWASAVSPEIAE